MRERERERESADTRFSASTSIFALRSRGIARGIAIRTLSLLVNPRVDLACRARAYWSMRVHYARDPWESRSERNQRQSRSARRRPPSALSRSPPLPGAAPPPLRRSSVPSTGKGWSAISRARSEILRRSPSPVRAMNDAAKRDRAKRHRRRRRRRRRRSGSVPGVVTGGGGRGRSRSLRAINTVNYRRGESPDASRVRRCPPPSPRPRCH